MGELKLGKSDALDNDIAPVWALLMRIYAPGTVVIAHVQVPVKGCPG